MCLCCRRWTILATISLQGLHRIPCRLCIYHSLQFGDYVRTRLGIRMAGAVKFRIVRIITSSIFYQTIYDKNTFRSFFYSTRPLPPLGGVLLGIHGTWFPHKKCEKSVYFHGNFVICLSKWVLRGDWCLYLS